MIKSIEELVETVESAAVVPANVWQALLNVTDSHIVAYIADRARMVAQAHFGLGVYVRALIEISSCCRNNCLYCGLRSSNRLAQRYRLGKEHIIECCRAAAELGFNTFVLQGGEDSLQSDEWLADVVATIKSEFPEKAVTLSVGERSAIGYAMLRAAGADRYLLRHETADSWHYSQLHPKSMSIDNRQDCLAELKRLGFQVGSGMMVGSPGQTTEHLVKDLMFLDELKPQMIGLGPFIPASGTPFANEHPGSVDRTLLIISLLRLRFPAALIPATTAIATLCANGTERAILAGANVVMPNMTPLEYREKYTIYNNKKGSGSESAQQLELLARKLDSIGYFIDFSRGDCWEVKCENGKLGS